MADVGLARVSTLDQDPQLQLDALEQAGCWPIYQEHVSGVSTKRPVRDQALAQLTAGDTLTIWKLDRLGRSASELLAIIEDLDQRKIRFRCLTQSIDTSSATGRLQLQLLAAFSEFERAMIRERTVAGKQARIHRGLHPGGARMYGWTADHTAVVEQEAAVLREVAQDLIDGQPFARVVDKLNEQGVPPVKADRWRVNTVQNILTNPRVIPILGQEQYDTLAQLLAPKRRPGRTASEANLLSGVLTCGRDGCGQPMYAATSNGKRVYRCHRLGGGRFSGCGRSTVSLARADDWAREAFISSIVGEEFTTALNQRQAELLAGETTVEELDAWRTEVQELEQVQGTRFFTAEMTRRHDDLQRMVRQATAALVQRPDLQQLQDLPRSEGKLIERWEGWTVTQRRAWLKRLFAFVEVMPATERGRASDVEARMRPVFRL
jgi:DNA invertase Pin-like site-specific DNA recombinase